MPVITSTRAGRHRLCTAHATLPRNTCRRHPLDLPCRVNAELFRPFPAAPLKCSYCAAHVCNLYIIIVWLARSKSFRSTYYILQNLPLNTTNI